MLHSWAQAARGIYRRSARSRRLLPAGACRGAGLEVVASHVAAAPPRGSPGRTAGSRDTLAVVLRVLLGNYYKPEGFCS